jgi:hypothetical protein
LPFHHVKLPRRIYRVSYGDNPLTYPPIAVIQAREPGRWDDPKYRFRTGYFADSLDTCFIEVLAPLRPDPAVIAELTAMGEPTADLDAAVAERLRNRYASVVIVPHEDDVVDIVHARSRAEFEHRARRRKKTKAGDYLARDLRTSRRAAAIVYDAGEIGIAAPSAEAFALGARSVATTFNIFETALNANTARVDLVTHTTVPASAEHIALATARDFLGI